MSIISQEDVLEYLKKILAVKKEEIKKLSKSLDQRGIALKKRKEYRAGSKAGFVKSISRDRINIIAEIKKSSPSSGIINNNLDIKKVTLLYDKHGSFISGISVLTELLYFKGSPSDIKKVKRQSDLQILRKDFILSESQVYESAALGVDCILLISSILGLGKLVRLYKLATDLGLEVLVEIHNEYELGKAFDVGAQFIGINNRNLKDMKVDINTTYNILKSNLMGNVTNKVFVCESGIESVGDMKKLFARGINTFLIGSYFMKSRNLEKTLDDMELELREEKLI